MTTISMTLTLGSQHALRSLLDEMNEKGDGFSLAGLDKLGEPFLVALYGPYAEGTHVMIASPRDLEIDQGPRCEHCAAPSEALDLTALNYPVTVLVKVPE